MYSFTVTHTESRKNILVAHRLTEDQHTTTLGSVAVTVTPGAPVRLHVDDPTILRLSDASATNSAAAHRSQQCIARGLRLQLLDQFGNAAAFPPGMAAGCALRYPDEKVPGVYSVDSGEDELPQLEGSVGGLLLGQVDGAVCVFPELRLVAGQGRGDGFVEAVFDLCGAGAQGRSEEAHFPWTLTFTFTTDEGATNSAGRRKTGTTSRFLLLMYPRRLLTHPWSPPLPPSPYSSPPPPQASWRKPSASSCSWSPCSRRWRSTRTT